MASRNIYQPLDPSRNEIRLLHILPKALFADRPEDIFCTIKRISLDEAKSTYRALSDGSEVPMTLQENLYQALFHLRGLHEDVSWEPFLVWADALCINQSDDTEKTHQVQQMKSVYENALNVMVWLGVAADGSDMAIASMRQVYSRAMELERAQERSWSDVSFELNTKSHEEASFPLTEMVAFLLRPWWSRIWVVQEISAATAVQFYCGYRSMQEVQMYLALDVFFSMQDNCSTKAFLSRTDYEHRVAALQDFGLRSSIINELPCARSSNQGQAPRFMERLTQWYAAEPSSAIVMKATDPRDFVFSLLGISSDALELGLKPDYSKSQHEVFVDTAAAIISSGDMEILTLAEGSNRSLPSWVPDWESEIAHTLQRGPWSFSLSISEHFFGPDEPRPTLDLRPYMASRGIDQDSQVVKLSGQLSILSISVILLDHVDQIFGSGIFYKSINDDLFQYWDGIYTAAQNVGSSERPYHNLGDAFFRLLTLDRERVNSGALFSICRAREGSWGSAQKAFSMWRDHHSRNAPTEFWNSLKEDVSLALFAVTSRTVTVGKRPFMTKQGWIGMGPERMLQGDVVAIIAGAAVPFILRVDDQGHHRLIGEAYVQGVMDGEAVEMGLPVVDIDLY
ncbi:hypothetical protein ACEPPN_013098 [Leptodophora sp. 'Broadleaf-Isolate-01']